MDASSPVPPSLKPTPPPPSALASTPATSNTAAINNHGHRSPLPPNTFPSIMSTSPNSTRKRSIQDDEMGGMDTETGGMVVNESSMDIDTETTEESAGAGAGDRTGVSMQQPTMTGTSATSTPDDDKENQDALRAHLQKVAGSDGEIGAALPSPDGEGNSSVRSARSAAVSPAPSSDIAHAGLSAASDGAGSFTVPAAKKRKLSPTSKDTKQQEKEAKERQKQQEKARKVEEKEVKERQRIEEKARKDEEKRKREAEREEEKRAKDEERKKRDAEKEEERKRKEEKRKVKEEEKAAKEEEKRKKEEEKSKKERSQTKLNSFFAKPKPVIASSTSNSTTNKTISPSPQRTTGAGAATESLHDPAPSAVSDYQRDFPDFFLQSHTKVAPPHQFQRDAKALHHTQEQVDAYLKSNATDLPSAFRPSEIFNLIPYRRRCGRLPASVKEILIQMQNLADQAGPSEDAQRKPRELLRQVTMKSFRFGEDVRPPYQGTFTKRLPEAAAHRLMRNPFRRGLPETNYDYDSEAEWEEPEEGEELDSEEEDEMSEDGEDDMDGFLDDEDDHLIDGKRRLIVGDLEPVSTGIRWQEQGVDSELQMYKLETISDSVPFPIDPFSTVYWQKPKPADSVPGAAGLGRSTLHTFMGQAVSGSHKGSPGGGSTADGGALAVVAAGRTKQRTFPAEQLGEFKQVVDGSDLTKLGLLEILKKR
ncbi:hypothetical protein BO86DRAFT_440499 [Aspergillus japonicus CBS 114.51]|uniref:Chromatin assembly factor 1 subunit A n=2 Tax=Aspergillus TaxID=5052 RepID=A0A2V5HF34_ASPV1|nr:hypothetical protein BO86DRAFT_440499 [Aspergillus japonicus CBS 114.51]PYI22968.1 hypothetical protein BO99DRAFT_409735 [Aspergillus violaceofuscus CBS 115571]RAH85121.1 hypothetical protein BO86DRAFT_440499 [Aspergillus japonicus CBS 114.51]